MSKQLSLVWSDEFDYEGKPDATKWNYDLGASGFGNNESQFYTDRIDNAYVKDGVLTILGKKEDYENAQYTSARLTTYQRASWQYGRFEICAKLPQGLGTWPAIWMLSNTIMEGEAWPLCGEIDIMEHVGNNQDQVHFSLHTEKYNHKIDTQMTYFEKVENVSSTFNVYAFDWTPDYLEFFINDKSYAKFEKGSQGRDTDQEGWPFDQPFYLILNLALGGFWGGEIDDTCLPQKLEVQYVRVYEMK